MISVNEFLADFIFDDLDMDDFGSNSNENRELLRGILLEQLWENCGEGTISELDEELIENIIEDELSSW